MSKQRLGKMKERFLKTKYRPAEILNNVNT